MTTSRQRIAPQWPVGGLRRLFAAVNQSSMMNDPLWNPSWKTRVGCRRYPVRRWACCVYSQPSAADIVRQAAANPRPGQDQGLAGKRSQIFRSNSGRDLMEEGSTTPDGSSAHVAQRHDDMGDRQACSSTRADLA